MIAHQNSDLKDKVVLITGGSRGIGRAIAIEFAKVGSKVVINYNQNQSEAEKTLVEVKKYTDNCMTIQADVSASDSVKNMIISIEKKFGPVEILINNAAIAETRTIDTITEEDWDRTMNINLKSVFLVTQSVVGPMRKNKWGRIINISSTAVQLGGIIGPHYTASKAGIIGLTHSYASILVAEGITVNTIAPALIETEMISGNPNASPEKIPVKRFGNVDEVSKVALMLAQNGYITGQTINVNGGLYYT